MSRPPTRISPDVARQAAHWYMLMLDEAMSAAQRDACARWRAAAPEHEQAWQKAQRVQARLGLLPQRLAMGTLGRERRQVVKQLLVLAIVSPLGYVGYRKLAPNAAFATHVGQQKQLTLEDGSLLNLNTDTVIDVAFDDQQRLIYLRRGEILVNSGPDADSPHHRPLRIASAQGVMEAVGTRFDVRQRKDSTQLSVLQGAVRVMPLQGARQTLVAGQQLTFDAQGKGAVVKAHEEDSLWTRGQLVVDEMPLRTFLAELGRYRSGWLRCQDAVAHVRISGAFRLENTDAILAALPATLPVSIDYRTRYWVTVNARE